MKLVNYNLLQGSCKVRNRAGRTFTQGNENFPGQMCCQKLRSGGVRLGFEGGQTPLFRRLPKTWQTSTLKNMLL